MRILVIDDTQGHLDAARQTLSGHDLTLCSSHDEAVKLLLWKYDDNEKSQRIKQYESEGLKWTDAYEKAEQETRLPYWEVVLCDLLMPAGSREQGSGRHLVGQEMAVGWSLALQAVKNGANYVAVITELNHHQHPASAMIDKINGHIFTIDNAKMLMTNYVETVGIKGTEGKCIECGGTGKHRKWGYEDNCHFCKNGIDFLVKGKDWGKILNLLLTGKSIDDE
ncbi:MAG: hypothetical protein WCV59_02790 [Parcubacteria group bacterium]|jgi:CheY-like chemotaxis protein